MPASKDPRNYEKLYHDLSILMDARQQSIEIETTRNNAEHIRGRFYAYIIAWQHQAETTSRKKYLTDEERATKITHALHMEEILRRYMTVIDSRGDEVTLRFVLRDLNPRTLSAADQISSQIDTGDVLRKLASRREQDRAAQSALRKVEGVPVKGAKDYTDSPIANLFAGITVEPIDLPPEELEKGSTDLTDLLPPSKEVEEPSPDLAAAVLAGAKALRAKEKKDSAK